MKQGQKDIYKLSHTLNGDSIAIKKFTERRENVPKEISKVLHCEKLNNIMVINIKNKTSIIKQRHESKYVDTMKKPSPRKSFLSPQKERHSAKLCASDHMSYSFQSNIAEKVKLKRRGQAQTSVELYNSISDCAAVFTKKRRRKASKGVHPMETEKCASVAKEASKQCDFMTEPSFPLQAVQLEKPFNPTGNSAPLQNLDAESFCDLLIDKLSVDGTRSFVLNESFDALNCQSVNFADDSNNNWYNWIAKDELISISTLHTILPESLENKNKLLVEETVPETCSSAAKSETISSPVMNSPQIESYKSVEQTTDELVPLEAAIEENIDIENHPVALEIEIQAESKTQNESIFTPPCAGLEKQPDNSVSQPCGKFEADRKSSPVYAAEDPIDIKNTIPDNAAIFHNYHKKSVNSSSGRSSNIIPVTKRHNSSNPLSFLKNDSPSSMYKKMDLENTYPNSENVPRFSTRKPSKTKDEIRNKDSKAKEERRVVYVGGLPDGCTEQLLADRFKRFGKIEDVRVKSKMCSSDDAYGGMSNVVISKFWADSGSIPSSHYVPVGLKKKTFFGFVTYERQWDADRAVSEGSSVWPNIDVRYGGRRSFVGEQYTDLDEKIEQVESSCHASRRSPSSKQMDFNDMLQREMSRIGLKPKVHSRASNPLGH